MKKVSVIGAGSWGSALAVLLANNGHEVTLWSHDSREIEMLQKEREQKDKLPGVKLPENIKVSADLEEITRRQRCHRHGRAVSGGPFNGKSYGSIYKRRPGHRQCGERDRG